jgi:hypothetical protein
MRCCKTCTRGCVCVCVCVCERERERESFMDNQDVIEGR